MPPLSAPGSPFARCCRCNSENSAARLPPRSRLRPVSANSASRRLENPPGKRTGGGGGGGGAECPDEEPAAPEEEAAARGGGLGVVAGGLGGATGSGAFITGALCTADSAALHGALTAGGRVAGAAGAGAGAAAGAGPVSMPGGRSAIGAR